MGFNKRFRCPDTNGKGVDTIEPDKGGNVETKRPEHVVGSPDADAIDINNPERVYAIQDQLEASVFQGLGNEKLPAIPPVPLQGPGTLRIVHGIKGIRQPASGYQRRMNIAGHLNGNG